MSTYRELLKTARDILRQQEIADADVDAWYLFAHVFEINRSNFYLRVEEIAPEKESIRYLDLIDERARHIPLQHLTGTQEFMGLEFEVNRAVLIPRQDTESLVEEVLKVSEGKSVLDMCTGSGCIVISLAKLGGIKKAVGVDVSNQALEIAIRNANKLQAEVEFIQSDLFDNVKGTYDIIVSNPPYIPTQVIESLMPEVKNFEPVIALDGSEDGLSFYRRIAQEAKTFLNKDGSIFFEIGHNQGDEVKQILLNEGYDNILIKKDLSGLDRIVYARMV